ncbi:MAG: PepSY domain-containing protein [Comamonadaceae bacterium]|nr:PepSY domain-containing protein [Comamonadaceae bacterium]
MHSTTRPLRRRLLLWAPAALGALCGAGLLHADDDDHERARAALAQGLVLPLTTVLAKLPEQGYPGQVLKVEFEHEHGRYVYEIRLLQADGRVVKLDVDARDARVLKAKTKGRD